MPFPTCGSRRSSGAGLLAGETWLHALLLGIAALDRDDKAKAWQLFDSSIALKPTWLGFRQRALVATDAEQKTSDYLAAWRAGGAPIELAVEFVDFLLRENKFSLLQDFVGALPNQALENERIVLARAKLAARRGALDELEALLKQRFATIREGEVLLDELWTALQKGRLEVALGRLPTATELAERLKVHPIPERLDFRMREAGQLEEH